MTWLDVRPTVALDDERLDDLAERVMRQDVLEARFDGLERRLDDFRDEMREFRAEMRDFRREITSDVRSIRERGLHD